MEKLQKARTALSVGVAGFTASTIALLSDQIVSVIRNSSEFASQNSESELAKIMILFFILIPALYIMHVLFKWLTTYAFNVEWIRKLILGQDYVEGYWLVDNSIDDHVVSTGFMHYQIVDERLKINGSHFSPFDDPKKPKRFAETTSIAADCVDGEYYNHFKLPGVGYGVANGKFSSRGKGGSIPDSFKVQVVLETSVSGILEWAQNAPGWINESENSWFSYLAPEKKKQLIQSMVKGRIVTMHQHGVRLSKKDFRKARDENPKTYQRVLAKKHYDELHTEIG